MEYNQELKGKGYALILLSHVDLGILADSLQSLSGALLGTQT